MQPDQPRDEHEQRNNQKNDEEEKINEKNEIRERKKKKTYIAIHSNEIVCPMTILSC